MSQLRAQVDKLLTKVSSGYFPKGYVSEAVLPLIQVKQYSGLLGKYGQSHLRIENSIKGGRGKYRRVETLARSTTTYLVEGHGLEGFVSKEDYANVEEPFDAEKDETIGLTTSLWLEKEKVLADSLSDTAIITSNTTLAGTAQFSDYDNSDPIAVFSTARETIMGNVGMMPNIAILDILVWNKLRFHPQMLDALGFKYDRPGGLREDELASVLGVDKVHLAMARYNSAKEGQTDVLSACWGKHIVFAVAPDSAAPQQISLGYRVQIAGSEPRKVYKWDVNNPPGSKAILVEDEYDFLLSNVGAAYLIKNSIA
jgi:hypothetical protein